MTLSPKSLPRFLTFLLQSLNRVTLSDLHSLPSLPSFPLTPSLPLKTLSYLLDSMVIGTVTATLRTQFSSMSQLLLNAPSLSVALTQLLGFGDIEERMQREMQAGMISARVKGVREANLAKGKTAVWRWAVFCCWIVQCGYKGDQPGEEEYKYRY